MKKILWITTLLLISLQIVACKKETPVVKENTKKSRAEADFPQTYNTTIDKVAFKTKIIIDNKLEGNCVYNSTASLQKINNQKALKVFMSDTKIKEKHITDNRTEDGEPVHSYFYIGKNEAHLSLAPMCSSYSTPLYKYISRAFRIDEGYDDYNADKYSLDTELSFKSRAEAFHEIKESLSSIGITIGEEYKCYTLDYKTMKEEEYAMDMQGKEDTSDYKEVWSEADDCYYFTIGQRYQGLPLYHAFLDTFDRVSDGNSPVQAIYSKNGIKYLQYEKIFDISKDKKQVTLKPFEEIAKTVANKYSMILGASSYDVTQAELYYMAAKSKKGIYTIKPVWIIDVKENVPKNSQSVKLMNIIDAVTAEEIVEVCK